MKKQKNNTKVNHPTAKEPAFPRESCVEALPETLQFCLIYKCFNKDIWQLEEKFKAFLQVHGTLQDGPYQSQILLNMLKDQWGNIRNNALEYSNFIIGKDTYSIMQEINRLPITTEILQVVFSDNFHEWNNFNTVSYKSHHHTQIASILAMRAILNDDFQAYNKIFLDEDPKISKAKAKLRYALEDDTDYSYIFSQPYLMPFHSRQFAFHYAASLWQHQAHRKSQHTIDYYLDIIKDCPGDQASSYELYDFVNLATAILVQWQLDKLDFLEPYATSHAHHKFLNGCRAIAQGNFSTACDEFTPVWNDLLTACNGHIENYISKPTILLFVLMDCYGNQIHLHQNLMELWGNYKIDGIYTRYSFNYPESDVSYFHTVLWNYKHGQAVPTGKGTSWDNLDHYTQLLRTIALLALAPKYKKEDHLDKADDSIAHDISWEHSYLFSKWALEQLVRAKCKSAVKTLQILEQKASSIPSLEIFTNEQKEKDILKELYAIIGKAKPTIQQTTDTHNKRLAWILALEAKNHQGYQAIQDILPAFYTYKKGEWKLEATIRPAALSKAVFDADETDLRAIPLLQKSLIYSTANHYYSCSPSRELCLILPKLRHLFAIPYDDTQRGTIADLTKAKSITITYKPLPIAIKTTKDGKLDITLPDMNFVHTTLMKAENDHEYTLFLKEDTFVSLRAFTNENCHSTTELILDSCHAKEFPLIIERLGVYFDVNATLSKDTLSNINSVDAQIALILRIQPQSDGSFTIRLVNRPIPGEELLLLPGVGAKQLNTTQKKTPVMLVRDLEAEKKALSDVLRACDFLSAWNTSPCVWNIEGFDEMLSILPQIQQLPKDLLTIEWDKSKPIHVATVSSWNSLKLTVKEQKNGWLDIGCDLHVNENRVISFMQLLSYVQHTKSNYVQLDDQTYLQITSSLRKQLQAIALLSQEKQQQAELPQAVLPMLSAALGNDIPTPLKKKIKDFRAAIAMEPTIPDKLTADLRPYQIDGFVWMRRLAECNLGCCLADDMGIGKTLQAIALLLDLGSRGPSLVVAPASLVTHWMSECQRFAPTLQAQLFTGTQDERSQLVNGCGPFDVLVTTYGLLNTEHKLLGSRSWNCLILDEAQAIKNYMAQRSKAAKTINAQFRLALSGTPVENNLLELWSIFDFLNTGMLGSQKGFEQKMTDGEAVSPALKRAISPLILRRRKAEVLDELPPKTEITIPITLADDERDAYEALRQNAVKNIQDSDVSNRIAILAELTKLRCFCCHPSLAGLKTTHSAKLDTLMQMVDDLKQAGHRTLIFSQFVKFLDIVRKSFDKAGLTYSYLDGSTPREQRKDIVDAFNHGNTDFFLISLKAGGLGLNLTSADFVILLDPWWNPAVEQQAADRVHRIGQEKPVTIYRLACTDTVEERVLALHETKRKLAEDIFDETSSASLKLDELMALFN